MLRIEGLLSGKDKREKDGKTTYFAMIVDGMEAYKISSDKEIKAEQGQKAVIPVKARDYKGEIYYNAIG